MTVEVLDDLERQLTEILGQRPKLISVRHERQLMATPADPRTKLSERLGITYSRTERLVNNGYVDLVKIEIWCEVLTTPGRCLIVAADTLDAAIDDMLAWARKNARAAR